MKSRNVPRLAAAVIYVACSLAELARVALARPWPGFVPAFSHGMSILLAALWLASAVVVWRGPKRGAYFPVYGTLMFVGWGVTARAAGAKEALVYLALTPLLLVLERFALASPSVPEAAVFSRTPAAPAAPGDAAHARL